MSLSVNPLDRRIELRGRTGSGAMGEVYRAWDDQLDRAVAVKFQLATDDREAERLLLEARLQARVEHPNVIKVHEVGTLQGRTCIVFQLVDGPTLGELAADLTIQERVELLRQAALGLHAAHLQGLVHRDVKPGNVLVETGLDGARRALLGDFGLARAEEGGLSRTGVPTGTLEYMSPEQLLGNGPVDFRSDIYALGATLYALLAGRPPFRTSSEPGAGEASSDLFRRVLEEEPEPLHRLAPGTPRELGLVAARAMEKNPAARYPTAEAFAEELGRYLRGEPVLAHPPTLLDRGVKWARRNRVAARALAAAATVILVAGGLAAWTSRRASLEALEAARLGADAASLESRLRMEYLSEPHDLRPTLSAVKAEVERLRPLAARGSGPASYALGKGLELLDDLDGARAAYERARALGFRTPSVSESLGDRAGRDPRAGVAPGGAAARPGRPSGPGGSALDDGAGRAGPAAARRGRPVRLARRLAQGHAGHHGGRLSGRPEAGRGGRRRRPDPLRGARPRGTRLAPGGTPPGPLRPDRRCHRRRGPGHRLVPGRRTRRSERSRRCSACSPRPTSARASACSRRGSTPRRRSRWGSQPWTARRGSTPRSPACRRCEARPSRFAASGPTWRDDAMRSTPSRPPRRSSRRPSGFGPPTRAPTTSSPTASTSTRSFSSRFRSRRRRCSSGGSRSPRPGWPWRRGIRSCSGFAPSSSRERA